MEAEGLWVSATQLRDRGDACYSNFEPLTPIYKGED
jgi:hypothetical protein